MCKRPQTLAKISSSSVLCYILCLNIRIFYVFYPCQHVQRVLPQPARYMYIVPHCTGTFFFTGKFTGIPWCGKILQFTALASGERSFIPFPPAAFPPEFRRLLFSSHFLMPKVVQKARSISLLPSLPSSTFQPLWKLMWAEGWKEEAGLTGRKKKVGGRLFPGQSMSLSAWPCLEKCYL